MNDPALHVLIIDDDEQFCALLQRSLSRLGYELAIAHNATCGFRRASEGGLDVILLDHDLGEETGLDMLVKLRGLDEVPPVIFLTASNEINFAIAALKSGAADYVIKDIHSEFIALLDRAMRVAIHAARREQERQRMEVEVREARDRFKKMAEERELMLNEINHRISNSLQLVSAMLNIQGDLTADEVARNALNEARSRVLAIAQVHRSLYSSFEVGWVALDEYLDSVIKDLRKMNDSEGAQARSIAFETVAIQSTPDIAIATGIIVTELILNAFKHAYSGTGGEVRVKLTTDSGEVVLSVADDGVQGSEIEEAQRGAGFGMRLIEQKLQRLNGSINYQRSSSGLTVILRFPVSELVRIPNTSSKRF